MRSAIFAVWLSPVLSMAAPPVTVTLSKQAELDRRTPARLEMAPDDRLVLRVWVTATAQVAIADPTEGYVRIAIRDRGGRLVREQTMGPTTSPRPYSLPAGGSRNFLVVALPWCSGLGPGEYALALEYTSPGVGKAQPVAQVARTTLVLTQVARRARQHLRTELLPVGVSGDGTRATGQVMVHNDGCEPVQVSPADRMQVRVLDRAGRAACTPAKASAPSTPPAVVTVGPDEVAGLGLATATCTPPLTGLGGFRGHLRYDSRGLPGWPIRFDAEVAVERLLEPVP